MFISFLQKRKKELLRAAMYLTAFFVPAIAFLLVYKAKEIFPYGDFSVLCMDLWTQYFPMYVHQYDINSLSDAIYSFAGGLGYNNFAQSAYYCNSIFNLLYKMFSRDNLINVVNIICLLKSSFASVTCLMMLEHKYGKRNVFMCAGAIMYSLCSYALAYSCQCMWTDSMVYMPLIIIGLDRILENKRPYIYIAALAAALISNFYIGFSMCLFLIIYCVYTLIITDSDSHTLQSGSKFQVKQGVRKFIIFAVYSVIAAGIAAFVLIPTAKALGLAKSSDLKFPDSIKFYSPIVEYINAMLPDTKLSYEYGIGNISDGLFVFVLVPLFFFNSKIKTKEKIASALVIMVLYLSMNVNVLDFIWHGFHFPNQLPGRWVFLFTLFLIMIICRGLSKPDGITLAGIVSAFITAVFFLAVAWSYNSIINVVTEDKVKINYIIRITVFLILLFEGIVLGRLRTSEITIKEKKYSLRVLCSVISSLCLVTSALFIISDSSKSFIAVGSEEMKKSPIKGYVQAMNNFVEPAEKTACPDDDFYRTEANGIFTFDSGLLNNYNGITYYSSTMNGNIFDLMKYLGNRVYADKVSTVYDNTSVVQNSIFSVKYIMDNDKQYGQKALGMTLTDECEKYIIWTNDTFLPIAYKVSDQVLGWAPDDDLHYINNQNKLVNAMYGSQADVFTRMNTSAFTYNNVSFSDNEDWSSNYYTCQDPSVPITINYSYTCDMDTPVYLEQNFRAGNITVTCGDKSFKIDTNAERSRFIGNYKKGDVININITVENVSVGLCGLNLYSFDMDKWKQVYDTLSANQIDVTEFKNTKIKGTLNMDTSGLVFTSLPDDGGWKVYCDGKKVETQAIGNALVGFIAPQGQHDITFRYSVPGLGTGIIISVFSVGVLVFFAYMKTKKRVRKSAVTSDTVKTDIISESENTAETDGTSHSESTVKTEKDSESENTVKDAETSEPAQSEKTVITDLPCENVKTEETAEGGDTSEKE